MKIPKEVIQADDVNFSALESEEGLSTETERLIPILLHRVGAFAAEKAAALREKFKAFPEDQRAAFVEAKTKGYIEANQSNDEIMQELRRGVRDRIIELNDEPSEK